MASPLVHLTLRGDVARVELDKPPVNAFDHELVKALASVVREFPASGARVAVFSGRGSCFGAGGDIKWMHARTAERDSAGLQAFFGAIQKAFDDIERLPMPTIAAIHGMALGGGLELALACDLRVAARDARIGFPEATIGLIPAAGGTQRLTEIVGRPIALELLYSGRVLGADDAAALRLINRLAPADELGAAVDALVSEVLRSTPAALAAVKGCVRTRMATGRTAGLFRERLAVQDLVLDPAAIERLDAFYRRSTTKTAPQPTELEGALR